VADEVVFEKDFPCPCGNGILRVELLEHDTWVSGQHRRDTLLCEDCKTKYVSAFLMDAFVLREHNDEMEKRQHAIYERRRAVGEKAAEKYLLQFQDYVKGLKFKTTMHSAVGSHSSMGQFYKDTRYGLDAVIEDGLKSNPAHALAQIKVEDAEIVAELEAIAKEDAALKAFIAEVPKCPLPKIERP
jgi:hypothetical protein